MGLRFINKRRVNAGLQTGFVNACKRGCVIAFVTKRVVYKKWITIRGILSPSYGYKPSDRGATMEARYY